MLPVTTRRVSNSIASCSYTSTRSFAAARVKERANSTPTRSTPRQSDFLTRLKAHQVAQDAGKVQSSNSEDRNRQNTSRTLTVKGLKPIEVVQRINALLREEKLDHAITMVENLPLDAVNVVVWNVLIQAAIKQARYKLAFELFYDMKRRHVKPNTRTFSTLFVGLSNIEDWAPYSNILERAFIAYDQLLVHFEKIKLKTPNSPEISTWPLNGFLVLLGNARRYARMWDVFFSMEGQLAPDEVTYTIMLRALERRKSLNEGPVETAAEAEERANMELVRKEQWIRYDSIDTVPEETLGLTSQYFRSLARKNPPESVQVQNAADARLLWEQLQKAHNKDPSSIAIEGSHVALVLHLLSHGRPSDHMLAFDIVRDYVDIDPPIRTRHTPNLPEKEPSGKLPVTGYIFASILELCVNSARAETAIQYFQTVAERPNFASIIQYQHMMFVMRAFAMRRPPKGGVIDAREAVSALEWMLRQAESREIGARVRPGIDHFVYGLTAAWRGADMGSALHIFEMVTGIPRKSFMAHVPNVFKQLEAEELSVAVRRFKDMQPRYVGCTWNTTCMALLLKTARATEKREHLRVALRIIRFAGMRRFFNKRDGRDPLPISDETLAAQKELATRIVQGVDWLLHHDPQEAEAHSWNQLRDYAARELEKSTVEEVHRQEDKVDAEHKKKEAVIQDGQNQLLVTLKGRKSQWATGL